MKKYQVGIKVITPDKTEIYVVTVCANSEEDAIEKVKNADYDDDLQKEHIETTIHDNPEDYDEEIKIEITGVKEVGDCE